MYDEERRQFEEFSWRESERLQRLDENWEYRYSAPGPESGERPTDNNNADGNGPSGKEER